MTENKLIIDIKASVKPIIKYGFAFQGILIVLVIIAFLLLAFFSFDKMPILSIVFFIAGVFFYFASRKFFENVFLKETIIIENETLKILIINGGNEKKYTFNLNEINHY